LNRPARSAVTATVHGGLALTHAHQGHDAGAERLLEFLGDAAQLLAADPVQHPGDHLGSANVLGPLGRTAATPHRQLALGVASCFSNSRRSRSGRRRGRHFGHRNLELLGQALGHRA